MNDILTEIEVAVLLDCEPGTVQQKARSGEIPALKMGRSWRFPRAALIDALNDQARSNMQREAPQPKAVKVPVRPCLVGL